MNNPIQIAQPTVGQEELDALRGPIESGWLTQGPMVAEFENSFSRYIGSEFSIAVTSCTTGLQLALSALGIKAGDEVIVPALTWVSTANVVIHAGAKPIFVDIDSETFNIDPDKAAMAVTEKTKAVIAVHLFGLCADIDKLKQNVGDIPIIEDAACAFGAKYKGTFAGNLGTVASFSFHPRKTITTGEGGMVTTSNSTLAEKCQRLRNHGASISEEQRHHGPKPYLLPDFQLVGFNFRMTDLQGAIGTVQMRRAPELLKSKQKQAARYNETLAEIEWIQPPFSGADYHHAYQAYVCQVKPGLAPAERNALMEKLQAAGISTRPGTHSVPHLSYYREAFAFTEKDFPNAFHAENFSLALPAHFQMTESDQEYVIDQLRKL